MPTSTQSWRHGVTRYQWLVLFIAWLGWVFDAMDATIYAIVLHPALHDLLQAPLETVSSEQVGWYGGIIFSIFLIGLLVTELGTFGRAASTVALIYLVGLVVLIFAPETKGHPLPE